MIERLIELKIVPNKTHNFNISEEITSNKDFFFNFLRGFIDGDGTISFLERKQKNTIYKRASVVILCNSKFCERLQELIYLYTNIKFNIRKSTGTEIIKTLSIESIYEINEFLSKLYDYNEFSLSRKRQNFEKIKNYANDPPCKRFQSNSEELVEKVLNMIRDGFTYRYISKFLNLSSHGVVSNIARRNYSSFRNKNLLERTLNDKGLQTE